MFEITAPWLRFAIFEVYNFPGVCLSGRFYFEIS